jgi:hypothetical protein
MNRNSYYTLSEFRGWMEFMLYFVWTYCLIFHNICLLDKYYISIQRVCLNLEDEWNICYTLSELIAWFFIISVFWTDIIFQCRDSVWTTKHKKCCDYFYTLTIFYFGIKKIDSLCWLIEDKCNFCSIICGGFKISVF